MRAHDPRWAVLGGCCLAAAACVPADEAIGLGSVQFAFKASQRTRDGIIADETVDHYAVTFDRVLLGFKTMTIGKIGVPDTCSYRGRGALSNVVFDPRLGLTQTFNGITPVDCPDVGIIFGTPDNATTLGDGASFDDLAELTTRTPALGIVEATARLSGEWTAKGEDGPPFQIKLRFDAELTATRFGGCRAATRGARILEGKRDEVTVRFAAENLLREAISTTASFRLRPFIQADAQGNNDDIATMDELDDLRLTSLFVGDFYQLPNGTQSGSFGDFVRALFRFTILYRTDDGLCVGNEPGTEEEGVSP